MIDAIARSRWSSLMFLAAFGAARALAAGDQKDPDWPCVQRKVPSISAGMVWAGPELAEDDRRWQEHADITELVGRISSRRTALEEAYAAIDSYAATLGTDRNEKLTLLFAAVLQTINDEHSAIIQGIERYARRQKELADKIKSERADLAALHVKRDPSEEERARIKDLEKALPWDMRVFDERRESLTYVCESPVLLEQRIFLLAKHVMALIK